MSYGLDGLNRLKEFRRGTLAGNNRSIADGGNTTKRQIFSLDQVGNWTNFKSDAGDGSTWDVDQDRTHNKVNEITQIEGSATHVTYSARGNMTKAPKPDDVENHHYNCTYDAWNRLVKVQTDAETPATVAEYQYDGTNRRIVKLIPNGENWDRTDYYHQVGWQVVEERYANDQASKTTVATEPKCQYVWSLRYIDSPILRDRDTTGNGELDERLYYLNDANMNVTTLVDTGGDAQERYIYEPYGKVTIYNSDWSATVTWANSKKNEVLYCGYRYDPETGLYHVRNRDDHPTLGRWLQRDPLGYADGMNLYDYVESAPVTNIDPTGQWKRIGRYEWCAVNKSDTLKTLAKKFGSEDDWVCLWPTGKTQDHGYASGQVAVGDTYDVTNIAPKDFGGPLWFYRVFFMRPRRELLIGAQIGEDLKKHRLTYESTGGKMKYVTPNKIAQEIRDVSGEGGTPIWYLIVAGHSGSLGISERTSVVGIGEDGRPVVKKKYTRFTTNMLLKLDKAPSFARASKKKGPVRCWFSRNALAFFAGCKTHDAISKSFAQKVLRKGAVAWGTKVLTGHSYRGELLWDEDPKRKSIWLKRTKNWKEAPVWEKTPGSL